MRTFFLTTALLFSGSEIAPEPAVYYYPAHPDLPDPAKEMMLRYHGRVLIGA